MIPIHWTKKQLAMLGKIPDPALARIMGIDVSTVTKKRLSMGVKCCRDSFWTPEKISLLGHSSDKAVALALGIHKATVARTRKKLGICSFSGLRKKPS